eukprot:GHRR01032162.1.p1 GENE.GHRR01032162.1~~GHRR01032162.1.p1  ORF type:complete len:113 (+),score=9.21 GHRR01032162.1:420-758(+)
MQQCDIYNTCADPHQLAAVAGTLSLLMQPHKLDLQLQLRISDAIVCIKLSELLAYHGNSSWHRSPLSYRVPEHITHIWHLAPELLYHISGRLPPCELTRTAWVKDGHCLALA